MEVVEDLAAEAEAESAVVVDLAAEGCRVLLAESPEDPDHRSAVHHHSIAPAEVQLDRMSHRRGQVWAQAAVHGHPYSQERDQTLEPVPASVPDHRLCQRLVLAPVVASDRGHRPSLQRVPVRGQGLDRGHRRCQQRVQVLGSDRGHRHFRQLVPVLERALVPESPIDLGPRCQDSVVAIWGHGFQIRVPEFRTVWPIVRRLSKAGAKT